MQILKNDHYNVKLDIQEWRALAAWIDCNAPYYGSWEEIKIKTNKPKMKLIAGKKVKLL
jgi:hypothetical protein